MFEYGSRVGFWRVLRLFQERGLPLTVFGCALALERNPAVAAAIRESGCDVCSHGWRWVKHYELTRGRGARAHPAGAIESMKKTVGERPLGWYCRYGPSVNTRRLLVEEGGFLYDSDAYNDELPYWVRVNERPHLVVPYSLTANDSKFGAGGFFTADDYFTFVKDGFDVLYREGRTQPKMMSLGLHLRLIGHPSRAAGLERALDYIARPQGRVVHPPHRHRPALDRHAPGALALKEPKERAVMGKLDGKVALISGGARGQGAAEAETFAREGAQGRLRRHPGRRGQEGRGGHPRRGRRGRRTCISTSPARRTGRRRCRPRSSRYGKLDILINNAAIVIPRVPIEERTVAEWDRVMAVNAKGVFLGTKHAIPAMRRAGGGSIVNISSVAGIGQSLHQEPAYAASKGAIRIFTKVTASQHAKDKIRCNSVHPGPVDTEMFHSAFRDPEAMERRLRARPAAAGWAPWPRS